MVYEQLYADFLQQCQPGAVPGQWARFEEHADCWHLPCGVKPLVEALREKYDDNTLVTAGLFERDTEKTARVACRWLECPGTFLALRTEAQQSPFDLLTADGAVSGDLPIRIALDDHAVKSALDSKAFLLVAFSISDLVALRAVGLPAVSAAGLERFSAKSLEEFRHVLTSSSQSSERWPQQLILTGWSPSRLIRDRPQLLEPVVDNLRNCDPIRRLLPDILVWAPTGQDIQAIGRCAALGTRDDVVAAILESLDGRAKPLALSQKNLLRLTGLAKATADLRRELLRSHSTASSRRKMVRRVGDEVELAFAGPLLAKAAAETDPEERMRLTTLAGTERILTPTLVRVAARLEQDLERNGVSGDGAIADIVALTKLVDAKSKLMKREK